MYGTSVRAWCAKQALVARLFSCNTDKHEGAVCVGCVGVGGVWGGCVCGCGVVGGMGMNTNQQQRQWRVFCVFFRRPETAPCAETTTHHKGRLACPLPTVKYGNTDTCGSFEWASPWRFCSYSSGQGLITQSVGTHRVCEDALEHPCHRWVIKLSETCTKNQQRLEAWPHVYECEHA